MSFRLKLILVMAGLVTGVSVGALVVNQRIVQQQYRELIDSQLAGQMDVIRDRQDARLQSVFDRIRDASRNPRLAAGFLIEEPNERAARLYTDLGAELAPVLDQFQAGPPAFFRIFDFEDEAVAAPSPVPGLDETALTERLASLLTPPEAGVGETTSGYLLFDAGGEKRIYEAVVQPTVDEFDGSFLGTFVIAIPISDSQQLLGRQPGVKVALAISGEFFGDQFSVPFNGDPIELDGQRYEVHFQDLAQGRGFDPAGLVAAFSLTSLDQAQARLRRSLLMFGLGAFGIGTVLSYLVSGQISRPISELTRQTREILSGNLGDAIPVRSRDEVGALTAAFNEMSAGLALKEKYRAVLDRVTDPRVAEELTRGSLELGGEERETTILFCDIRGFVRLSEHMSPTSVVAMLNAHMTALTEVASRHNGVVDKFIGDEIMILFGSPHAYENDALDAVRCATEMIARRRELNETSVPPIHVGIGIATGPVLAGCMGSENRLNYTALGARVNLAARLCSRAGPLEILIDKTTFDRVQDQIAAESAGEAELKGFRERIPTYRVTQA